jgi:purine catabolism regulator
VTRVAGLSAASRCTSTPTASVWHGPAALRPAALWLPEVARLRLRGLLAAAVVSEHGSHVVLQPLGLRGRARGFLAVGSSAPLTPTDQAVVNLAVSLLSLSLARAEGRSAAERAVRAVALRQLLDGQGSRVPVEGLGWTALGRGGVRVVLVAPVGDAGAAAEEWLAEHTRAAVARGVLDDEPDLVVGVVAMEADLPDPEPGGPVVRAGVGEPGDARDADSLARSLLAARRALAAAPAGRTVRQDDLGAAGLEALLDPAAADAWAASLLRPLDDPGDKSDLAGTLAAWLAHHGQVDAAATELGVHRHTVRHRLRRAETLLGRPLDDAGVRAELWLALRRRR